MKLIKEPIKPNWKKIVTHLSILIVSLFVLLQVYTTGNKIHSSWQEIKFAYEKPQMVKDMREKYQSGVAELEKSFNMSPAPTPTMSPSPEPSK